MQQPYNLSIEQISNLSDYQKYQVLLRPKQPAKRLDTLPDEIPKQATHRMCCKWNGLTEAEADAKWELEKDEWTE